MGISAMVAIALAVMQQLPSSPVVRRSPLFDAFVFAKAVVYRQKSNSNDAKEGILCALVRKATSVRARRDGDVCWHQI